MYQLCRKNCLAQNIKQMEKFFPHEYKIAPKTWNLPYEINNL